jgi:hypothetical protein
MGGLDPCLAGIVGIVRLRVVWFNGQTLFERSADDENNWIYAIEAGAPDPRDALLRPTGEVFGFTDPNGVDWNIVEYNFTAGPDAIVHVEDGDVGYRNGSVVADPPEGSLNPEQEVYNFFTWVVRTGPVTEDYAATGKPYNFVDLVDTCKFALTPPARQVQHARDGSGNWTSDWSEDPTREDHDSGTADHGHEAYDIHLYIGTEPRLAPAGDYLGVVQ